MSRAMKRAADIGFAAISIEGGLIAPDQLLAIASAAPDQKMATDYGCPKGTNLLDEITRYFRIAQAHWQSYAKLNQPTIKQTSEFVKILLEQGFGFSLTGPHHHEKDDRRYTIAWEAKGGRIPVVVAPPAPIEKGKSGDGFARALPEFGDGQNGRIARRSPTVLLQDWLNANSESCWGLVFAGDRVRLMRDNASLTRPAWIEADLGSIFRDDMFADFTALWLLIHVSRFGDEGAAENDSALEQWREAGMRAGISARDRLRINVEDALLAIGQGILDANPTIRDRLDTGTLSISHLFEQMLRVIYRLIFLGVAEDRDLLHPPETLKSVRDLYSNNYGFSWLRDRSTRRSAYDHHFDAWEAVKVVFRALAHGENLLGLPALGGLFDIELTPELVGTKIPNRSLLTAAFKLGWLVDDGRRIRINWRDMATEELGSVYEGLLELVPLREDNGRIFSFAGGAEARGNARKISGSYYTPDSLVQCLLDSALDPVMDKAEAYGGADAILDLKVIDPACGSGHFLLGAARRMATRVAQLRNPDSPDYNAAMRDIVRNCIHGVDRNPMAIELAKVALWIESVEPGKPLGFLDANLQCGDSLLGLYDLKVLEEGIPDEAYKPLAGDDKDTARYLSRRNKDEKRGQGTLDFISGRGIIPPEKIAAEMRDLRYLPEDNLDQIVEKRRLFTERDADPRLHAARVASDLYIAAFLLPKKGGVPANHTSVDIPTTAHVRARLAGEQICESVERVALEATAVARVLHWPLAFPEVMIRDGGFDLVLGNPPWERIKLQEKEYFASRNADIANAKNKAVRDRLIKALKASACDSQERRLFDAFEAAKRHSEASSIFVRLPGNQGGRFPYTGNGDVNTYALFAELFTALAGAKGTCGLIIPSGIATDESTKEFLSYIIRNQKLSSLFELENEGFFKGAGQGHMLRFALTTIAPSGTKIKADLLFQGKSLSDITNSIRRISISQDEINVLNPNTQTLPIFRTMKDHEITLKCYRNSIVVMADGKENPWQISFGRMFDMTNDADKFQHMSSLSSLDFEELSQNKLCPLYESKLFYIYNHRYGDFADANGERAHQLPTISFDRLRDPSYEVSSYYCVSKSLVEQRLSQFGWKTNYLMGWRNVTDARASARTVIFSVLPICGVGNSINLLHSAIADRRKISGLIGNLSSIVFDYLARNKIGGLNLNHFIMKQLPVLPPDFYTEPQLAFILPRVMELTYTSNSISHFAKDLGYESRPFSWDEDRRAQLRAELDAWYALAYGLNRDELRYILDPKDIMGPDYPGETFRVLQKNELANYGEYRTQRLVLSAYDTLVATGMRPRAEGRCL
jgi:hypothetical protein